MKSAKVTCNSYSPSFSSPSSTSSFSSSSSFLLPSLPFQASGYISHIRNTFLSSASLVASLPTIREDCNAKTVDTYMMWRASVTICQSSQRYIPEESNRRILNIAFTLFMLCITILVWKTHVTPNALFYNLCLQSFTWLLHVSGLKYFHLQEDDINISLKHKVKVKVLPITGHEGPKGE